MKMKNITKKFIGLVLGLVMVVGLSVSAMAADFDIGWGWDNGEIVVATTQPIAVEQFRIGRGHDEVVNIYTFSIDTLFSARETRHMIHHREHGTVGREEWRFLENPTLNEYYYMVEFENVFTDYTREGDTFTFSRPGLIGWYIIMEDYSPEINEWAGSDEFAFIVRIVDDPTEPTEPTTPDGVAPNLNTASGWAHNSINQAFELGLIPAALQNNYTANITRAEFASLAVALYETITGEEIAITREIVFNDTTDINVHKAAYIGVVQGVGDGNFAPDRGLTRQEAAVMLARLAYVAGQPLAEQAPAFADNAQIAPWAFDAVGQMQASGIMGGVGDNMFAPQGDYTREQSIITILRLLTELN
jgi:hypothetical protein